MYLVSVCIDKSTIRLTKRFVTPLGPAMAVIYSKGIIHIDENPMDDDE